MAIDLHELEAIKQLKYRYLRCIDRKLWSELRDILAEDATSSYGGGKYSFQGRDQILAFLETLVLFPPDDTASNLNPGVPGGDPQTEHGSIALSELFQIPDPDGIGE